MTSINITLDPDAAFIVTDALQVDYLTDRRLLGTKCLPLPHLRAAVAIRGPGLLLPSVFAGANLVASFEVAAAQLGEFLRSAVSAYAGVIPNWPGSAEAFLVGFALDGGMPQCWYAHDGTHDPSTAWQPRQIGGITTDVRACPPHIQALAAAARTPCDISGLYVPNRDGPALIEALSQIPGNLIGGACHLTTVARNCIYSEVLATWPEHLAGAAILEELDNPI
ncbi:hypothetical protein SAMN02799631_05887 [Methylobacterium sp. 174MFSha1.1]|uniref:hypothetical protein n=1 Tax=Methylobacterium sp. 174MFSha1.1 TaxID=1502749 RepID=UPI0008F3DB5F|nr:hypothetical protein [Methylobacterium sp. 174MFSha1.1]SFV14505.1 hypothetical protein SAMN02799631_05887 [Methylobacterium sp. 174MFSha1.1]